MIYLDWNATAPLRPCARDAWLAAQEQAWGNPASTHRAGQQARAAVDAALASCAASLGCGAGELVVTSGGSEALASVLRMAQGPVVASAIDHSAVLRNAADLRSVPVDGEGRIDPTAWSEAAAGAAVVVLQLANNEVGTVQDAPALVAAVRAAAPQALILADACQLVGKAGLHISGLGVDALALAGHKLGAPKGVGLLWLRRGLRLAPLIAGGRQQQDRRSGTEDAALTSALAAALAEALAAAPTEGVRQAALLEACWATLSARLPALRRLAAGAPRLPNTLGLVHPGIDGRHWAMRLDLAGCCVSTGSACMAGRGEPSHVARALCRDDALARSFIRVSIGPGTTAADLDAFGSSCIAAVGALAGAGAVAG